MLSLIVFIIRKIPEQLGKTETQPPTPQAVYPMHHGTPFL